MTRYSVGVDIGSTFTDVACAGSDGSLRLMKRPTRGDPAAAVRDAIEPTRAEFGVDPATSGRHRLAGTYRHRGALKPAHP